MAAAGAVAAAAAIANAIKASGVVVRLDPADFQTILRKIENPLVIYAKGGFFGLTEELKWGKPCYTFQKSNIVIIQGFKEYCALMFCKGAW